jgi:soluble lytic murein transglycosylase-like protein
MQYLILAALLALGILFTRYRFLRKLGHTLIVLVSILTCTTLRMHVTQAHPLSFGDLPQKNIVLPTKGMRESEPETVQIHADNVPAADLVPILKKAGFSGEKLRLAYAVMRAESGGRPKALNVNSATGDKSYGIFQINMIGRLGPARLKEHHLKSYTDLFDPLTNAKIAYKMSKGGSNWQPWGAWRNGAFKYHLAELPASLL